MTDLIKKIDLMIETFRGLSPMKQKFQENLDRKFLLEFNYNSNHIEGNTLTYRETELLLFFGETKGNHSKREHDEMEAHNVAFSLIKNWAGDKERALTEGDIKNLNKVILVKPYWADAITQDGQKTRREIKVGNYKEYPNSVQLSNGEIFEYASVTDTPILMGELVQWFRDEEEKAELHPVALAALLHYKFVRIHPFDDGNGRISRLLMNYVLLKNQLPPVIIKSTDKKNYLSALNHADAGDLDSFINYVARQLVWSLELSIKSAKGENIEEADDLEKEISLWKKQVKLKKIDAPHRSDKLIYEIYKNSIKELFEQIVDKLSQFNDLFDKSSSIVHIQRGNHGSQGSMSGLNGEMENIKLLFDQKSAIEPTEISYSDITSVHIQTNFEKYNYLENNAFTVKYRFNCEFLPYRYKVQYANKEFEKKYSEFIGAEERQQIISDCVKWVFEEIKNKSGNEKP